MSVDNQQLRRVEEPEEETETDKEPGRWKKAGRGFMNWSRGGDNTLDILKAGAKDAVGPGAGVFEGFFKGKTDNLKDAEKKLKDIHEKEFNLNRKIADLEDKLEKDEKETIQSRKMGDTARAKKQAELRIMKEKHRPELPKEREKAEKQVRKLGGNVEQVQKKAKEIENIYDEELRRVDQNNPNNQGQS